MQFNTNQCDLKDPSTLVKNKSMHLTPNTQR